MIPDSVGSGAAAARSSAPAVVTGINVGKHWLAMHFGPSGHARRFPNDKLGRRALRNWLRQHGVERAVFKPTGWYHRQLHQCLAAGGLVSSSGHVLLESLHDDSGTSSIPYCAPRTTRSTAADERCGPTGTEPAAQAATD